MEQELPTRSDGWGQFLALAGYDFLCEVDRQGRYLKASPNYGSVLGHRQEDLVGRTPFELGLIHPEDVDSLVAGFRPLFDDNKPARCEYRFRVNGGGYLWMESAGSPFQDETGAWRCLFISRDITERKAMEASLAASEARYRALVEHAAEAILMVDAQARIAEVNARACSLTGYPQDELLGMPLHRLIPTRATTQPLLPDNLLRGCDAVSEGILRRKDGAQVPVETSTCMLPTGQYQTFVRDITEKARILDELRRESRTLGDIIDHHPMSIQLLDRDGRRLRVNPAHIRIFGDLPASDYSIWTDPVVEQLGLGRFMQAAREGQTVFFPEICVNSRDLHPKLPDRVVWIRTMAFSILDSEGRPDRYVFIHDDLTSRRQAEQALTDSEKRLAEIIDYLPDPTLAIDAQRRVTVWNKAIEKLTGVLAADMIGKGDHAYTVPFFGHPRPQLMDLLWEESPEVEANYTILQREPDTIFAEAFAPAPRHGGGMHMWLKATALRDEQGNIVGAIETIRDVTYFKQAEQTLRQAQKLESLGVLAGGIAHDFNNLLTAILGNLNLAQAKAPQASPVLPHLEAAERIVMKSSDLVRQMLAYSGKGRFVVRQHNLNEVVQEMAHLLQVSISKKVVLRLCLPDKLPDIEADSAQIQQVIMNLVTNASEAVGEREGLIRIATGLEELEAPYIARTFLNQSLKPGRFVTLEVSDTGCGITPDVMERIFDPFFSTKASGRGLGLSAMLGILRGHGAGYKVYSEVGRGTTFKIFFPASGARQAQVLLPSQESPEPQLEGMVLLVDDDPSILESSCAALELLGLQVTTAKDGREALEIFRQAPESIDLVLMDLTMPRMDGRETFSALRQIRPDVRVILSSGYSEQESIQEFIGKGLAGFIQKPYKLKDLRKAVGDHLHA